VLGFTSNCQGKHLTRKGLAEAMNLLLYAAAALRRLLMFFCKRHRFVGHRHPI
jgi:hypothetical protein